MRRLSGFSLMEMMVVLLIVSIVAAASAPMISKKAVSSAENDSPWVWTGLNNNIAYNLNNAEQSAIIGGKYVPNDASKARLFIKTKDKSHPQISLHDTIKSLKFLWANSSIAMTNKDVSSIPNDAVVIGNNAALSKQGAIAIGSSADASGTYGIAVGYKAIGSGTMFGAESNAENCALAVGHKAKANSDYTVAVGHSAEATNGNAIAIGYGSNASGGGGIAIGKSATGDGTMVGHDSSAVGCSVAYGPAAKSKKSGDTAIGYLAGTTSSGNGYATALGYNAQAGNAYSVALGADSTTGGVSSIAIGYGATTVSSAESDVSGSTAIAIGLEAEASGTRTVAIGDGVVVRGKESVMIGHGSQCNSEGAVVIGGIDENTTGANPFGSTNSVAVGRAAKGGSPNSVALGAYSYSTQDSVAVGYDAYTEDVDAVAIGFRTTAGLGSVVIGANSEAGALGIAIGSYDNRYSDGAAIASGVGGTAIGYGTLASGEDSIAFGSFSEASGTSSIAIGAPANGRSYRAKATAANSVAISSYARTDGENSVALGYAAYANASNSVALGRWAGVSYGADNSVAIGNGAYTSNKNEIMLGTANHRVTIPGELYLPGTTLHINRLVVDSDVILNKDRGMTLMRIAKQGGEKTLLAWPLSEDVKGDDDNFRQFFNKTEKSGTQYRAWHDNNEFNHKDLTLDAQETVKFFEEQLYTKDDGRYSWKEAYAQAQVFLRSSDRRLKNVGEKFKGGLAELKKLDLYHYTYKKDKEKTPHVGVMAQDLQKVFPNAVKKAADGYLVIRWDEMFFALINAIKELDDKIISLQKQEITALKKDVTDLKKQNADLEKRLAALEQKLK